MDGKIFIVSFLDCTQVLSRKKYERQVRLGKSPRSGNSVSSGFGRVLLSNGFTSWLLPMTLLAGNLIHMGL
jgi:hypothetical protein